MSFKRSERVSESIKREASVLILREVKDPDVVNVTVTDVETSDDLRNARVFVSVMGDVAQVQGKIRAVPNAIAVRSNASVAAGQARMTASKRS